MAFLLEPMSKTYDDKPLTDFPVKEDVFERMMDITIGLTPLVQQYNSYYAAGNLSGCNTLLANNPELQSCLFNAEKYNRLRDSILAVEEYLLTQVDTLYNTISQHAVGINDQASGEEASLVAYSVEKINQLFEQMKDNYHTARKVSIPASGWSDQYPYTNTVPLDWAKKDQDLRVVGIHIPEGSTLEEVKSWNKSAGFLMEQENGVQDKSITFQAYKKPTVDFTVLVQGG